MDSKNPGVEMKKERRYFDKIFNLFSSRNCEILKTLDDECFANAVKIAALPKAF